MPHISALLRSWRLGANGLEAHLNRLDAENAEGGDIDIGQVSVAYAMLRQTSRLQYLNSSSPSDIAPTLWTLLEIEPPSNSVGRVLTETIKLKVRVKF